ncbi:MAG: deoxyribodipyrimidine photo-lyase [Thermoleophilaceae bacterium]|nr:deoxyribodipyrimidine photo-lyase [Thermoleophilaceae bacterium]
MTSIVWFRRDLRVHEHPALRAALDGSERVVPVFCLDDRLIHGRHASGPRTQFMLECLTDLDASLRERGTGLVLRHGPAERELPALAEEVGAGQVHFTADVTPFSRARGETTGRALRDAGVELCPHPGLCVADAPGEIRTKNGKPYTVFSPFWRSWKEEPRRDVAGAPRKMPALPSALDVGKIPILEELGLEQEVPGPASGGESEGRKLMNAWLRSGVEGYGAGHDAMDREGTSRLSPYLRFGCVSARELEDRAPAGEAGDAFRRQLCWRDFYQQAILHFPANAKVEFQERYRGTIDWSHADKSFETWTRGRTGFPLVDAGMRQLRQEGWMHNRARLVVGSFLTKDLGIDWRWGERWFMRLLIDGDQANNNGNWQWIASVGMDPQPAFKRIFNPALHQERFDPRGKYVRRYVPELNDVPDSYLGEPWEMPPDVQREVGCVIGVDYPEPVVDHKAARQDALERYRV